MLIKENSMLTKKIILLLYLNLTILLASAQSDFLAAQKKYSRVRTAINEKEQIIRDKLNGDEIELGSLNVLIVAYKAEGLLNLYTKNHTDSKYKLLITYPVCAESGELGPKRKQGDYQVPEGFYYINRFNPASSFFLSLGINYPNKSDKIKSNATYLGGDIFIHGDCVTIGCLPMTDDKIKEIYLYATYAKQAGQHKIPVYIYPFKMTSQNLKTYSGFNNNNSELIEFWNNLKTGYDLFQKEKKELKFRVNLAGDYLFID